MRLVFESGRPIAQVAKDLGIGPQSLRTWVRQAEADAGKRTELLSMHQSLGDIPPAEFEALHAPAAALRSPSGLAACGGDHQLTTLP